MLCSVTKRDRLKMRRVTALYLFHYFTCIFIFINLPCIVKSPSVINNNAQTWITCTYCTNIIPIIIITITHYIYNYSNDNTATLRDKFLVKSVRCEDFRDQSQQILVFVIALLTPITPLDPTSTGFRRQYKIHVSLIKNPRCIESAEGHVRYYCIQHYLYTIIIIDTILSIKLQNNFVLIHSKSFLKKISEKL